MRGIAYGVGVGPGDPELMTLKAVRLIREADVIAVPGKDPREAVAYRIAAGAVPEIAEKELVPVYMPMVRDRALIDQEHRRAAALLKGYLDAGKNVVLSLEIDRAAQVKRNMPEAVCVYMAPSTDAILRARYEKTARSPFEVTARMDRAAQEKAQAGFCDAFIPTDDEGEAAAALNALLDRA